MESLNAPQHYVYTLAYPDGRVFYVGKGMGNRILDHELEAREGRGSNRHKLNTIRKIWAEGGEVVRTKLAHFETNDEALMYEIALVFFLPNLTNLTHGGQGSMGRPMSERAKEALSRANTGNNRWMGKHHREESKRRISEAKRGQKPTFSEEQRQRMAEVTIARNRSRAWSEEARQKIAKANSERIYTEEMRKNRSQGLKGKAKSIEHRQKISEAARLRWERERSALDVEMSSSLKEAQYE